MKLSLAGSSCALALALCTAGPAAAQDVTFSGTLVDAWSNPFPELTPGTPFAGCYTVNLATPDYNGLDWVGDYGHCC